MNASLLTLDIRKSDLPRQKIRDHVRSLIVSGELGVGMAFPSTRELSSEWKIPTTIVHGALSDLVLERYLIRRQGKGTFVADRISRLRSVGLYLGINQFSDPARWFIRSMLVELTAQLQGRGISAHPWTDTRSPDERNVMWGELETATQRGQMQGVILLDCTDRILKWAPSLPVPLAAIAPARIPFGVSNDPKQMLEVSLEKLAQSGCRSVGLITNHPVNDAYESYYARFLDICKRLGLKIRNSWIRAPKPKTLEGFAMTRFGYDQFLEIWKQKERPDGLLVEPDIVVEGVIGAVLQTGVKVPEQMKFVFHRNESHQYLCPFPVTQLVTSEKAHASALIDQLEKQVSGQSCSHIVVPYRVEEVEFRTQVSKR